MQSLEEDALLKGTLLAAQQPGGNKGHFPSSASAMARTKGGAGSNRVGEGSAAAAGGAGGEDAEEPQTDGDETDDYSDQV